jgi:hypothetical protein
MPCMVCSAPLTFGSSVYNICHARPRSAPLPHGDGRGRSLVASSWVRSSRMALDSTHAEILIAAVAIWRGRAREPLAADNRRSRADAVVLGCTFVAHLYIYHTSRFSGRQRARCQRHLRRLRTHVRSFRHTCRSPRARMACGLFVPRLWYVHALVLLLVLVLAAASV